MCGFEDCDWWSAVLFISLGNPTNDWRQTRSTSRFKIHRGSLNTYPEKLSETPKTNYLLVWQYLTQPWFCRIYILCKQGLQTKCSTTKNCKPFLFSGTCKLRVSITSPKLSPSGLSLKQLIRPVTNDTLQLLLHEILLLQVVFFSMMRRWRDVSFMFWLLWLVMPFLDVLFDRLTLSCGLWSQS